MSISRAQVGCFLLILLSLSGLNLKAMDARYVEEEMERVHKFQVWRKRFSSQTGAGSFATVDREVPSSPDPLHNRKLALYKPEKLETMLLDLTSLLQHHSKHQIQWQRLDMESSLRKHDEYPAYLPKAYFYKKQQSILSTSRCIAKLVTLMVAGKGGSNRPNDTHKGAALLLQSDICHHLHQSPA
ncbi:CLE17 protein [Senna tora]|uniref:CLE17 protein n=1 Tax=Senna tora TaxID=362788 RepID=A0A834TBL9_9FABA|nr:CLE17 protein [Senna tora]